jgi:hypothetical protein
MEGFYMKPRNGVEPSGTRFLSISIILYEIYKCSNPYYWCRSSIRISYICTKYRVYRWNVSYWVNYKEVQIFSPEFNIEPCQLHFKRSQTLFNTLNLTNFNIFILRIPNKLLKQSDEEI